MSTKIVSTPSAPLNGEISKKDLRKIHSDYMKHVKLESTEGRVLKKTEGFYIDIDILKAFIEQAEATGPTYTKLLLQFGITLPEQKTCSKPFKSIGNSLAVTFFIADGKGKVKDSIGNGVLTAGFKASQPFSKKAVNTKTMADSISSLTCCINPVPPNPNKP
ncbi:MAG: hypothetical protein WDM71_10900 [Ferruginibacter sp.]